MGYRQQVQRSLDSSPGFLLKNPAAPHRTVLPNWEKETQIRVFPEPHPDGGFKCMRESSADNDFSEAVWAEPVARSLGVKEQFTYIDRIPGATGKTPTSRFVESILSLIEEKPRDVPEAWIVWPKGGKSRAAKVQKVKTHVFWQGMEIMRKGTLLKNESGQIQPQYPVMIVGAVSLQMSFEQLANKRVDNFPGPMPESIVGDDVASRKQRDQLYAQMFQLGDWCSIDGGRIMSIFQAEAQGKFTMNHYALALQQPFPLTQIAEHVRQMWVPWNKLLKYHTAEEHVQMLCRAFPPEAVDYAFGTSELRDLLPNTFKDAWKRYRAAESRQAPGMSFQQDQSQMQQPPQAPAPQAPAAYPAPTGYAPPQMPMSPAPQAPAAYPAPTGYVPPQMPMSPAPMNMAPSFAPPAVPQQAPMPGAGQQRAQPPQQPMQQPPAAPPAQMNFGGMAVNFSGAPLENAPSDEPESIMRGAGFVSPPEFAQPPTGAPAPVTPAAAPAPTAPAAPAVPYAGSVETSTPAGAGPTVDQAALQSQLAALRGQRGQSAQGNNS